MQTAIEELLRPSQVGSNTMSSVKAQLLGNFRTSKEYRHAFVEEKVRTQLAVQIKAIREQRDMTRPSFARVMHKAPSWVFRLEDPNQAPPTISTLLRVAEAFDVDLDISFRRFSDLLNRIDRMTPESFQVPCFEEEVSDNAFDKSSFTEEEMRALLPSIASSYRNPLPGSTGGIHLIVDNTQRKASRPRKLVSRHRRST